MSCPNNYKALTLIGRGFFVSDTHQASDHVAHVRKMLTLKSCGFFTFSSPCGVTDMPVPDKDPNAWAMLAAWLAHHSPTLYGFFLAVAVAIVRVIYGGGSVRQMTLEGALCGLLSLTMTSGLELIGLPLSAAAFAGGMVGFMGTEAVREFAFKWFGKRVDD